MDNKIFIDELCRIDKLEEITFKVPGNTLNNEIMFDNMLTLISTLTSLKKLDLSSFGHTDYYYRLEKDHLIPLANSLIKSKSIEEIIFENSHIEECTEIIEFLNILRSSKSIKLINLSCNIINSKYVGKHINLSDYPFKIYF